MKELSVTITSKDWEHLRSVLLTPDECENAAVLLCGMADTADESRLLVRKIIEVPPDLYTDRNGYHLEVSPQFYNNIITECLQEKLNPVIIHSHIFDGASWYSKSDDFGESRLLPVLESLIPGSTVASLVMTKTAITGRQFIDGRFAPLARFNIVGPKTEWIEISHEKEPTISTQFDRQIRAFGETGQRTLQKLKVGIVGVGGIGSLVIEQLARVGIKDFTLVDTDVVEQSNLSRIIGADLNDLEKKKVEVVGNHILQLGAEKVNLIEESAIRQNVLLSLRDRDLIFSCVDNDRTRAILNRYAHQYLVPVIDLGTRLDGRKGSIQAAAGRVSLVGSNLTCLRCSHHLNPERIHAESLPTSERHALEREGYIIGIDDPAPAIISINAVVAGLGVTAGLNLYVGLTGGVQPLGQIYDAASGSVFTTTAVHQPECDVCDETTGVKALGDIQIVSAY